MIEPKQDFPIRASTKHQLFQAVRLFLCKGMKHFSRILQPQSVIQKDLVNFYNIFLLSLLDNILQLWELKIYMLLLQRICPNHPQNKLMLFHFIDILVHPGGYTSKYVGITPLQYETDSHN